MIQKSAILMLVCAAFGMSGCYSTATPQDVLGSAYKALSKNNVKKFPKLLTGEAKARYGTLKGMADLQERLSEHEGLEIGSIDLVDSSVDTSGKERWRQYLVQIVNSGDGKRESVLSATVDCDVYFSYDHNGCGWPTQDAPAHGPHHGSCYHPGWVREHMECLISKID